MSASASPRLVADGLVVEHRIDRRHVVRALDGASLSIAAGDTVAVMGDSGAGKSTLALALRGLVPLAAGRVLGPVGAGAALVLQRPEAALFGETVAEDIALALEVQGMEESDRPARVAWALEAVGLDTTFAGRDPLALSGGEQRRVAIAGALATGPDLLILDEPTAGLDGAARRALRAMVGGLAGLGVAVVVVTHDAREAALACRRLVVLAAGRVACDATTDEVLGDPARCAMLGLEPPPAVVLADAIARRRGIARPHTCDELVLVDWIAAVVSGDPVDPIGGGEPARGGGRAGEGGAP